MSDNPFDGQVLRDAHYRRADMACSNFDGVNLANARFYAVLTRATFTDTNLAEARFNDVNLASAIFDDVNLAGIVVTNANLSNASISDANLTGMRINGILVTDLLDAYARSRS